MPNDDLNATLQSGLFPFIGITIIPLQISRLPVNWYGIDVTTFIEYRFKASVTTPVADFSFTFANPTYTEPFTKFISEGDIILLQILVGKQKVTLSTGIIDTIETQVTITGETVSVMGRDLLSQWADQCVYSPFGGRTQIGGPAITPKTLFSILAENTRIQPNKFRLQGLPNQGYNIGFNPTETKLQVLTRYLEAKNALVWSDPDGTIVMGFPNMVLNGDQAGSLNQLAKTGGAAARGVAGGITNSGAGVRGTIICNKKDKQSNVLSIRSTRSAATIPNFILPMLTGQSISANQIAERQGVANPALGPARLASLGHIHNRVYPVSDPTSGSFEVQLNESEKLKAAGSVLNLAALYAAREMARENMREVLIQAVVPGHLNESGEPYQIDQIYNVNFDRDGIEEAMYLYEVEYSLSEQDGPRSHLMFTRLNTIVAGNNFQ